MSWLDGLTHRIRTRLLGDRYSREQSDEIREHLALEAAQHVHEGATSDEASAAAHRRFGNVTATREDLRAASGFSFVDRIGQDLRYAARGLRRTPGFTITVVLMFALGVGANGAAFSFLDRVFLRAPAGVDDPGGIRRLYVRRPPDAAGSGQVTIPWFSYQSYEFIRDGFGSLAMVVAYSDPDSVGIGVGELEISGRASWVGPGYFTLLGVSIARGRLFSAEEMAIENAADVAIITHEFWTRALGASGTAIGQSITLARRRVTIVGIAEPGFSGIDIDAADVFLPLGSLPRQPFLGHPWYRRGGFDLSLFARVTLGGSEDAALATAAASYLRRPPIPGMSRVDSTESIVAGPIVATRGPPETERILALGSRIGGIAAIVLLIACINLVTLQLVRAAQRRREVAVRLALGVSRVRLVGQFVTESLLLAAMGGTAAAVVAWWGGAALRGLLLPSVQWAGGPVDVRVLVVIGATALAIGTIAGLAPGLYATRMRLGDALKSGAQQGVYRRSRTRNALLAAQSALAVVLVAGAGLFARSLENVRATIGYSVDSLLFATPTFASGSITATALSRGIVELAAELHDTPGIVATAYSTSEPMKGWLGGIGISLPGRDSVPELPGNGFARMNWVSSGFFSAVGIPLVAGRAFVDTDGAEAVIVNETLARTFWPGEDALGKCIEMGRTGCAYVVGIARNAAKNRVIEGPTLQYFRAGGEPRSLIVRVAPRHANTVAQRLRAAVKEKFPNAEDVGIIRMRDRIDAQLRPWQLGASLSTAFGVLAVVVAAIGAYSVLAYAVAQRTREVGVRVALGSTTNQVVGLVLREGMWVVTIGALLGLGAALAAGKLIEAQLYGVTPRDPIVLAGAVATLLAMGALASIVPSLRAARVDPVTALRVE